MHYDGDVMGGSAAVGVFTAAAQSDTAIIIDFD